MKPQEQIPLTKHRQIVEAVTREITEGRLKPCDRIPSEKEFCSQWQASRSTVRKALDQLSHREQIFRVKGKGSFVSFPKISHQPSQIMSFAESMKAQGFEVQTRLIVKEVIEPSEEIAAFLKLMSRELVLKIQRLQIVEGEPIALQTSFLPLYFCKNILNESFESTSISDLLQKQCDIQFLRSDIWIESPNINRKERAMLGDPRLSLFLARVRLTFNQRDEPVRFSRGIFRGDRVRLKVNDSGVFELDKVRLLC